MIKEKKRKENEWDGHLFNRRKMCLRFKDRREVSSGHWFEWHWLCTLVFGSNPSVMTGDSYPLQRVCLSLATSSGWTKDIEEERTQHWENRNSSLSVSLSRAFRIDRLGNIWVEFRRAHKRVAFSFAFACRQANVIETIEEIKENREQERSGK